MTTTNTNSNIPLLTLSLFGHTIAIFALDGRTDDPIPMARVTPSFSPDGVVGCFQANKALLNLPRHLVRAAIGHEFGHLALGHYNFPKPPVGSEDYILHEAQADVYSAARLGSTAMIELLQTLYARLIAFGEIESSNDIAQRIDLLKIAVEGPDWERLQLHVSGGAGTGRNERRIPGRKNRRHGRKGRR